MMTHSAVDLLSLDNLEAMRRLVSIHAEKFRSNFDREFRYVCCPRCKMPPRVSSDGRSATVCDHLYDNIRRAFEQPFDPVRDNPEALRVFNGSVYGVQLIVPEDSNCCRTRAREGERCA